MAAPQITRNQVPFAEPHDSICTLGEVRLTQLLKLYRHGSRFGFWETAEEWLPPSARDSYRMKVNLRTRILNYLSETSTFEQSPLLYEAILSATRYLLLLRIAPSGLGDRARNRSLDVTTISKLAHETVPALFALGIEAAARSKERVTTGLLSLIDVSNLYKLKTERSKLMLIELRRMRMLRNQGLWRDVPEDSLPKVQDLVTAAEPRVNPSIDTDPHRPLPDDYAAEMAWKSLWLSTNVTENLIAVFDELSTQWDQFIKRNGRPMSQVTFDRQTATCLHRHVWVDQAGSPIVRLPFEFNAPKELHFQTRARKAGTLKTDRGVWPPRSMRDLGHLVDTTQTGHYYMTALSIGPRASEALGLERTCVVRSKDGSLMMNGRTFKLVERFEGDERDWAVPDVVAFAIERQTRLVESIERLFEARRLKTLSTKVKAGKNLWGRLSTMSRNPTAALVDINRRLQAFAVTLGMEVSPGGQNIRSHRFRKTLARIVALALTQAPKLLMSIFGHKSMEMTLHYILSDPGLRAEIETVARELRVMRAKEAIETIAAADLSPDDSNLGGFGGRAAVTLADAIDRQRQRLHRQGQDWGQESAFELAQLMTDKGETWNQVRPGVFCTKLLGEVGACNRKRGAPEPSNCTTGCDHRLEEGFLREDVDSSIQECLKNLQHARSEGEKLIGSYWESQIRAHVPRFADLQAKWMMDPVVAQLFAETA